MPRGNILSLSGTNYDIAAASLLPKGKRAIQRRRRASQNSDPGRIQTVAWELAGPIGQSRERGDGFLGHDWSNLETRQPGLLTSLGAVSTTTLSSDDSPRAALSAMLGVGFMLGTRMLGGGTSSGQAQTITHIGEDRSYLFVARGAYETQVSSAWAVVNTTVHDATIKGMGAWYNKGRLGFGSGDVAKTRVGVTSTGTTYADIQVSAVDVYAKEMAVGSDRLWFVRSDLTGTNENRIRFTQDDFASASSGFPVGDPGINTTGLGTLGPFTFAAGENGVWSFTDDGVPVPSLRAIQGARSGNNGRSMTDLWGWLYVPTVIGLYAVRPGVANPVGIGTEAMWGFEGFDGMPVAVWVWRESLFVVYEDSAGTTWRVLRGVFGPGTDSTGQPEFYPFAQRSNGTVRVGTGVGMATNPHIAWGEGPSTLARVLQGRGGRDFSDQNYSYSTSGGAWYGSTLMRSQHLRKTLRWGRFATENMASGNTWALAVSMDEAAYVTVGTATSAAYQKIATSTPATTPTGHTIKPRLTQVAGGGAASTSPPQIRGRLELCYDERPDTVLDFTILLVIRNQTELTALENLTDGEHASGKEPIAIGLPDDSATYYGFVTDVDAADLAGDGVLGATVRFVLWESS